MSDIVKRISTVFSDRRYISRLDTSDKRWLDDDIGLVTVTGGRLVDRDPSADCLKRVCQYPNVGTGGFFALFAAKYEYKLVYFVLSCSMISETEQSKIKHRVSSVFVVIASPFFMRWMVFAEIPCLKIS